MTKKYTGPPYMKLEYRMLEHPAFETLSGNGFKLLIYVRKRFDGANNGQISFSTREAATLLRCSKDTAGRAFEELVDHQLLEPITKSAFTWKTRKIATEWRVTFIHMNGRAGTNDYLRFEPPNGPTTRTNATAQNSEH